MQFIDLEDLETQTLNKWHDQEKKALQLINIISNLRFDRAIELLMFRDDLYDSRPSELLDFHKMAINYIDKPLKIEDTLAIANAIYQLNDLSPARIDLGIMTMEWISDKGNYDSVDDFVFNKLHENVKSVSTEPKDVVLYGFGRIGRVAARRLIEFTGRGDQLILKAIVIRPKLADQRQELVKRVALLRQDSVHGRFRGTIDINQAGNELLINGNHIKVIYAQHPTEIDYTEYGIQDALLIDNTGVRRDEQGLKEHLRPGISKVLLTAPGKGIPNIVYGVNENILDLDKDNIVSAASCTTNAIVPIIKVIDDRFHIKKGHIETIHAYTSDQNLLDNFHKKPRRGRGAAINMVLTTTGAASAVSKVMPHLAGKLTGNAVRVPTPNVSLAIMSFTLTKPVHRDQLNNILREASLFGPLVEQLHYSTSTEYVSSHAVGMTSTSVIDAPSTIVSADGKSVVVYAWYDNEFGYTCQVVRLAKHIARVKRFAYY